MAHPPPGPPSEHPVDAATTPWVPLLEVAARTGNDIWVQRRLFEHLGRWSSDAADGRAAVFLAEQSRRRGWHAEVLLARLPELSVVDPEALVVPAGPGTAALVDHLDALDDAPDAVRLAVSHRVVVAMLVERLRSQRRELSPVADAATRRWLGILVEDDLDAWATADAHVRRLVGSDPAELDRVGDALLVAERLALRADGLSS